MVQKYLKRYKFVLLCLFVIVNSFFISIYLYSNFKTEFREARDLLGFNDKCILPTYQKDYINDDIAPYIYPNYNPYANCNRYYKPLTELVDRKWRVISDDKDLECRARCHTRLNNTHNTIGDWTYEQGPVNCEVLETVCRKDGTDIYGYLHSQIIKQKTTKIERIKQRKSKLERQNVIVILMDSLSFGDSKRSFKKTTGFLTEKLQAVEFPYVNKVGENSRPNGVALWFGKSLVDRNNTLFGGGFERADWTNQYFCDRHLDDELHLYKEFKENGYKTFNAEDWQLGILLYPKCKGFRVQPYDHYMQPFQTAYEQAGENVTKTHLNGENCRETHQPVMEYLQSFIDAYPEDPKFSWIWLSNIGHGHQSGFYRVDNYFADFMERNQEVFDNSFVIFMGDHGHRYGDPGKLFKTDTAQLEISNPYLSISIPKKYRENEILGQMRENAKKLQTHFDTRATILDIIRYQPYSNFTFTHTLEIPNEKGHSYFRRSPDFDRNCGSLPIPRSWCICQAETETVEDDTFAMFIGQKVTNRINEIVGEAGFSTNCIQMELDTVTSFKKYKSNNGNRHVENYIMNVEMKKPSLASYRAIVQYQISTDDFQELSIVRNDRYGHTADCIYDEVVRPYCYCKSNIV